MPMACHDGSLYKLTIGAIGTCDVMLLLMQTRGPDPADKAGMTSVTTVSG